MKKILSILLVLFMLLTASAAMAEGMGVQVIGGNEAEMQTVSLDDIQLNVAIDVPDNCSFTPTSFQYVDMLRAYKEGVYYVRYLNDHCDTYLSGEEAEYAMLRMDILNTQTRPVDFLSEVEVKVVSDDKYEFAGWAYQYNYNNTYNTNNERELAGANKEYVINAADRFAIDPMYTGHYVFGCTLPNAVVNGKTPLRIEITFAGNEITYNIRK